MTWRQIPAGVAHFEAKTVSTKADRGVVEMLMKALKAGTHLVKQSHIESAKVDDMAR